MISELHHGEPLRFLWTGNSDSIPDIVHIEAVPRDKSPHPTHRSLAIENKIKSPWTGGLLKYKQREGEVFEFTECSDCKDVGVPSSSTFKEVMGSAIVHIVYCYER